MPLARFGRHVPAIRNWCGALLLPVALLAAAAGPAIAAGTPPDGGVVFAPVADPNVVAWTAAPLEPDAPFYAVDWSLGLRGDHSHDQTSDRYETEIIPSVTLTHTGTVFSFHVTADAAVTKNLGGDFTINAARLAAGSTVKYNRDAELESNASLTMSQEDASAPDVATDVATTPVEIAGAVDSTFTRRFGRFSVALRGSAERDRYGASTLADGTAVDNSSQNDIASSAGLRLGFQLTPVLQLLTDSDATRTLFDAPSTGVGASLDGNTYTARAGVAAKWDTRLEASASIGVGTEDFDDPSLADVSATLYDASLTFRPDETLTLTGVLATTIGAPGPNGTGTARIDHTATAGATYKTNDWLDWRASAGWHATSYADSSVTDTGYSLGLGLDYLLSRHAALSLDYGFAHSEITPSPPTDTHTVSVGLTLKK